MNCTDASHFVNERILKLVLNPCCNSISELTQGAMLYSRGDLNPADYISRHLQGNAKCDLIAESAEQYVNFVMSQTTPMALSREEISKASRKDALFKK